MRSDATTLRRPTGADKARRVKARVVDRQVERHLPAQIEATASIARSPERPCGSGQQHRRRQARRDRGAAPALRVALGEVLVADDPIAILGEQQIDRVLRQHIRAPGGVEEAPLPIRRRKHSRPSPTKPLTCRKATNQTGRNRPPSRRTFSAVCVMAAVSDALRSRSEGRVAPALRFPARLGGLRQLDHLHEAVCERRG